MTNHTIRSFIEKAIGRHQIVVFSRASSDLCTKEALLTSADFDRLDVQFFDLDAVGQDDARQIERELFLMTGRRTAPFVFVNNQYRTEADRKRTMSASLCSSSCGGSSNSGSTSSSTSSSSSKPSRATWPTTIQRFLPRRPRIRRHQRA